MKEEKVARPDVLSYEQGRQDERKKVLDGIQASAVSVASLIEKARIKERKKIREEIEKELLMDEEISIASALGRDKYCQKCLEGKLPTREHEIYEAEDKAVAQAQLDKVLKALES